MRNYTRLLERRSNQERELFKKHKGNEPEYTYHGGYELGYLSGQVNILEDAASDVENLRYSLDQMMNDSDVQLSKYTAVCAELEEAHKEIEDLKQSLWNANYHHASFRGATYDEAKDYADKLERG